MKYAIINGEFLTHRVVDRCDDYLIIAAIAIRT
jgi:hypothetical protein